MHIIGMNDSNGESLRNLGFRRHRVAEDSTGERQNGRNHDPGDEHFVTRLFTLRLHSRPISHCSVNRLF